MIESNSAELRDRLWEIVAKLTSADSPTVELISKAKRGIGVSGRLGVFPASFNPLTKAHVEMISLARRNFQLDEILLLPGVTNADKTDYEAPLEDRVGMLLAVFVENPSISIGVASHPFFVDMGPAVRRIYAQPDIYFIVGSDTLARVLDKDGRYYRRYYKQYSDRLEALEELFSGSQFVVPARSEFTSDDLHRLVEGSEEKFLDRVHCLDLPEEARRISATAVRQRVRAGLPITALVPEAVERYIKAGGLYR